MLDKKNPQAFSFMATALSPVVKCSSCKGIKLLATQLSIRNRFLIKHLNFPLTTFLKG